MSFVRYEQSAGVVTLTMSSPQTRNALSADAVEALVSACRRIDEDTHVKAVVLAAEGPAFSAGGDLKAMHESIERGLPSEQEIAEGFVEGIHRMTRAVHGLAVPIVAAIDGPAIGAGLDLACMCDVRIASRNASFAESFVKLGLVPGDGGAWFLTRLLGRQHAAALALTGDLIDAPTALALGLVARVVEPEALLLEAQALAGRMALHSGIAVRLTKRLLRASETQDLDSVLKQSAASQALAIRSPEPRQAVASLI